MSFSYDPADLATPPNALRSDLGDTIEGSGIMPDSSNFHDEELVRFAIEEATHGRALARAVHVLAIRWTAYAGTLRTKNRTEAYEQAEQYAQRYAELVKLHGEPTNGTTGGKRYLSGNIPTKIGRTNYDETLHNDYARY